MKAWTVTAAILLGACGPTVEGAGDPNARGRLDAGPGAGGSSGAGGDAPPGVGGAPGTGGSPGTGGRAVGAGGMPGTGGAGGAEYPACGDWAYHADAAETCTTGFTPLIGWKSGLVCWNVYPRPVGTGDCTMADNGGPPVALAVVSCDECTFK